MNKKPLAFISYVSENLKSAQILYHALREQALIRPWMAHENMEGGDKWEGKLESKIKKEADFFIPLISQRYNQKTGKAQSEVNWALERENDMPDEKKFIIPVGLRGYEEIHPKLGNFHMITGNNWDTKILRLNAAMGVSPKVNKKNRVSSLAHNGGVPNTNIATPCFFPSISGSAKTSDTALDHLQLIAGHNPVGAYLVSAYDIAKSEDSDSFIDLIRNSRPQMQVLLDSGIYERKWLHREKTDSEKKRIWGIHDYHEWARKTDFDACFPYDEFRKLGKNPKNAAQAIAREINDGRDKLGTHNLYPIVHPKNLHLNGCDKDFISFCVEVALSMPSSRAGMLAIPERDLGSEIFEVAANIKRIRVSLNKRLKKHYPLHILGAGNPLSILVYSVCGADSFDGIDWCQTVAEYDTGRLYHPYLFPLFDKGEYPHSPDDSSPRVRMLAHNLSFYARWMEEIQKKAQNNTIGKMLGRCLPKSAVDKVQKILRS